MTGVVSQVASEFGLSESVGLAAMRLATQLLPDDPEIVEISLYRKYNRCIDGNLKAGDRAPDAKLTPLLPLSTCLGGKAEATSLLALLQGDRAAWWPLSSLSPGNDRPQLPLVVFAGSYT